MRDQDSKRSQASEHSPVQGPATGEAVGPDVVQDLVGNGVVDAGRRGADDKLAALLAIEQRSRAEGAVVPSVLGSNLRMLAASGLGTQGSQEPMAEAPLLSPTALAKIKLRKAGAVRAGKRRELDDRAAALGAGVFRMGAGPAGARPT